jgi:hypothetical protein
MKLNNTRKFHLITPENSTKICPEGIELFHVTVRPTVKLKGAFRSCFANVSKKCDGTMQTETTVRTCIVLQPIRTRPLFI